MEYMMTCQSLTETMGPPDHGFNKIPILSNPRHTWLLHIAPVPSDACLVLDSGGYIR